MTTPSPTPISMTNHQSQDFARSLFPKLETLVDVAPIAENMKICGPKYGKGKAGKKSGCGKTKHKSQFGKGKKYCSECKCKNPSNVTDSGKEANRYNLFLIQIFQHLLNFNLQDLSISNPI